MLKILILSYYYEPDLSAGSFRVSALVHCLKTALKNKKFNITIITTRPNRYKETNVSSRSFEKNENIYIYRVNIPMHNSGFIDQSISFLSFYFQAMKLSRSLSFDIVFATSGRLMTGFLGARISQKQKTKFCLDIRDLFVEASRDVFAKSYLKVFLPFFKIIENYTLSKAHFISINSPGFKNYINSKVPKTPIYIYTNGIDKEFIYSDFRKKNINKNKKILVYAGNIGLGQGLEKIIPPLVNEFKEKVKFKIIGNGGQLNKLKQLTLNLPKNSLEIYDAVARDKLINIYREADILFLHLNDFEAFKKVIPSKVFEYAATGKPIIAGVSGVSRSFIKKNIIGSYVFEPCNFYSAKTELSKILHENKFHHTRNTFIKIYNRENIMKELALKLIKLSDNR